MVSRKEMFNVLKPLPPLKNYQPKEWVGFDCETYTDKNLFYMVTFYHKDFKKIFYDRKKAIAFIKKNYQYNYIATNLQFDYTTLFTKKDLINTRFFQSGSLYIKLELNLSNGKTINFHETLAFFSASVKQLGDIVGVPKLEPPWDLSEQRKPKNRKERKLLEKYCLRDSEISYRFMQYLDRAFKKEGIKQKNTIASLSLEIFKRNYLDDNYKIEHPDILKVVFKAYFGGRTEVISRGTHKDVTYYDFNSLYPSCMMEDFPNPNSSTYTKQSTLKTIMNYEGVSFVKMYIPKMHIPPIPYRYDGKLLFPTGYINGHYTHLELRKLLELGGKILEVGEGVFYRETCSPFQNFVTDIYKKRLHYKDKGDNIERFYKIILNSLYGKFATKYYVQNLFVPKDSLTRKLLKEFDSIIDNADLMDGSDNGFVTLIKKDDWDEPPNYLIPIWSTYITAYARLKLYSILENPIYQPNVCYMDTDSVMLNNGLTLPESPKLGDLKLEGIRKEAVFIRPKMYMLLKPRIKGVKGKITKKSFYKIIEAGEVEQEIFTKFRTAMKSKPSGKYGVIELNQVIKKAKKLSFDDTKRVWSKKTFKDNIKGYSEYFKPQTSRPYHFNKKGVPT